MFHACHRFWKYYKAFTFCSLLARCRIPCTCHAEPHLNLQKRSEHVVFLTFWIRNVLRATTACTFSTSQLQKVPLTRQFFALLTSKCASRHNGVHIFDISTSKSGPELVCFVHFDFKMCFAPQRYALFNLSSPSAPAALASLLFNPLEPQFIGKNTVIRDFSTFLRACIFFLLTLSLLWSSCFPSALLWLFPPLLFHLSICSEVWLRNFLRWWRLGALKTMYIIRWDVSNMTQMQLELDQSSCKLNRAAHIPSLCCEIKGFYTPNLPQRSFKTTRFGCLLNIVFCTLTIKDVSWMQGVIHQNHCFKINMDMSLFRLFPNHQIPLCVLILGHWRFDAASLNWHFFL